MMVVKRPLNNASPTGIFPPSHYKLKKETKISIKVYKLQGLSRYAKILGEAPPGYDNGPAEWTVDVILDEANKKAYLESGGDKFYIKTDKENGDEFVGFRRKAQRADGTTANPIEVVGPDGRPWDQKIKIGNGSVLNVKYTLNEVKHKGVKRLKPFVMGIQVWEHVKYEPKSTWDVNPSALDSGQPPAQW